MGKKISLVLSLSVILAVMAPGTAKADIVYTFIKMTCDPASQSVKLKAFYEEDDAGEQRAQHPEKNIYPLDELGAREPQKYGDKVFCDLGGGETVAFAMHKGDLPKYDAVRLFFDGARYHQSFDRWVGYSLGYGGFALDISLTGAGEYTLKYCPEDMSQLHNLSIEQMDELAEKDEKKCEITQVSQGKLLGHRKIVDP